MGFLVTDIARMEDIYTRILEFTVADRGQMPGWHADRAIRMGLD